MSVKAHPNTVKMFLLLAALLLMFVLIPILSDIPWFVGPVATITGVTVNRGLDWIFCKNKK